MDSISESRLALVHPILAQKVKATIAACEAQGLYIRVVQGYRDAAVQAQIYAKGRTAPGDIVTHAPPGYSMHEFGMAVDCEPSLGGLAEPYRPDGVAASPRYVAMVAAAEAQGLVSGSHWHGDRVDWPHLQLPGIPVTPTNDMREALKQGLATVWNKFSPLNA